MYSLQLSTTLADSMRVNWREPQYIRTITRIAISLVVVFKDARSRTWVPRPARAENVAVLVPPKQHSWIDPFCDLDDDFVLLRGARGSGLKWTGATDSTNRRHGVNSLHDGVSPEHPRDPRGEPVDVQGPPFCRIRMHAEWLCYDEIH
jgi:hypothetical protein